LSETPSLTLHHYPASPYAEKIRAMFGVSGDRWGSVLSPPYPPRPSLQPIVGDFRRIPVAHVGADVFCDTRLIAAEVAELIGRAELAPVIVDDDARALAERAEGKVFFCAITAAPALPLLGKLVLSNGLGGTFKFVRDRAAMMKDSGMRVPQGKEAAKILEEFLVALDERLATRDVLDGRQLAYADFCAYHPVWLALSVGSLKSLRGFTHVRRWYEAIVARGHGVEVPMTADRVFTALAGAEPRPLPSDGLHHDALGCPVSIAPADYGKAGANGTLVAVLEDRYILARESERCGLLHLHFPREGYAVAS
jgi:glutathione S-transferase